MSTPQTLTITRPDDWHLHVRDGAALADVVPHTALRFGRAIIMPNLKPPVTRTDLALAYRERVLAVIPEGAGFEPLMTLYLTQETTPDEIVRAHRSGHVHAIKLYPAGATTHSEAGVRDLKGLEPVFEAMAEHQLPLLIHGEVTDPAVDIFDREHRFLEQHLAPLIEAHPRLRVVLEHITTREAVEFIHAAGPQVAATITPQHLLMNRNALFTGGIRPHHFCLPILKRERDRAALVEAATSGHARFFLGTDSAPHPKGAKESACGCAGIYSAHAAIELYAEVFEAAGALDRLEAFASLNGARFYGLPVNEQKLTLVRDPWEVPAEYPLGGDALVPLRAGETISWRLAGRN